MSKILLPLSLCSVIALATTATFSSDEQTKRSSMMARLKIGQRVKLEHAISGGYNVNILNDVYMKSSERSDKQFVASKIIEIGLDFITVDVGRGIRQTISRHAIDVITHLPETATGTAERDSKSDVNRIELLEAEVTALRRKVRDLKFLRVVSETDCRIERERRLAE